MMSQRKSVTKPGIVSAVVISLAILAVIIGLILPGMLSTDMAQATSDEPSATPTSSASPSPSPSATCDPRFVQVELDRQNDARTDPRYEGEIRPIITNAGLSESDKIAQIKAVDLKLAGTNAQTLANWADAFNLYKDEGETWKELVEGGTIVNGGCLSEKGREIYYKMEAAVNMTGNVKVEDAPESATNSGINGNQSVLADEVGIRGDRIAIVYYLADGTKVIRMVRCGNVVWITIPPNKPRGHTDNPPKPPTHEETPPPDDSKDDSVSVTPPSGWTPIYTTGPRTDGQESERQQSSGQTSGNVIDRQVSGNTSSGSTTTDMGSNGGTSTVAPDATSGGDDRSDDVVDPTVTNQGDGGTGGDTEIAPPPD